jgi:capsular exopolysaccharide synthesis family protein
MAKPLDNPGSVALRATVETNPTRPEPVVEFARKKSPGYATETDQQQLGGLAAAELEITPLRLADLPQISLPKDNTKPLVTVNGRHAKEALEAYKSLRTRLLKSQASQGFRSIAVTSVGRSEGKTLTAFNLACCCASVENFSVLLIDGDLRSCSLTNLIGRLPSVGLADVMSSAASCEQAIVRTDVPNLYVMGAGTSKAQPTELFSTERWAQVIRWSRHHFKMVLVDALSIGAFADFELMTPECDGVLVVVRARSTSREALRLAIEQLDANKLIGVVWNGSDSEKGNHFYS